MNETDNESLFQSNLSSDSLSQPSSSNSLSGPGYHRQPLTSEITFNPTNNPKFKGHQQQDFHSEYHTPSMVSGAMPSYGHQAYSGAAVSIATTNIQQQPVSPGDGTFLYPPPCHKYGYHATTASSVTSTVITHTGSTMGGSILGSDPQGHHGYSTTGDMYSPTSCLSQGYSSVVSAPALPSLSVPPHCFSAPQQPGVAGGRRGKHKQKTAVGVQMGSRLSTPQTAPPQTSFLAKLLSSSTQEREHIHSLSFSFIILSYCSDTLMHMPFQHSWSCIHHYPLSLSYRNINQNHCTLVLPPHSSLLTILFLGKPTLGFDATLVATKGHRSTSPNSPVRPI